MYVKGEYDFKCIKPLSAIGVFLIRTAIDSNPSETCGLDGALAEIAQQPFGPWLLGAVAIWIYREQLMHNKRRPWRGTSPWPLYISNHPLRRNHQNNEPATPSITPHIIKYPYFHFNSGI
ncbi:DUF1206 domain-containing protein [Aneurinibacillus migulanus]|uniref:DUF1206 domain-containing protein n=1 Tax=Aneurinibacillus migulanus TaxID=47500 RepID=UPI002E1BEA3F|nr:DUF1206 domain-containing protein [Aneurinibacillus migulanus]